MPRIALDDQLASVAIDDVLDDGKAEARAAGAAATALFHAVEALGQARDVLARNARAIIGHSEQNAWPVGQTWSARHPRQAGANQPLSFAVALGDLKQIAQHLRQLFGFGRARQHAGRRRDLNARALRQGLQRHRFGPQQFRQIRLALRRLVF